MSGLKNPAELLAQQVEAQECKPEVQQECKPEVQQECKPEVQQEHKPEVQQEHKPKTRQEAKSIVTVWLRKGPAYNSKTGKENPSFRYRFAVKEWERIKGRIGYLGYNIVKVED